MLLLESRNSKARDCIKFHESRRPRQQWIIKLKDQLLSLQTFDYTMARWQSSESRRDDDEAILLISIDRRRC